MMFGKRYSREREADKASRLVARAADREDTDAETLRAWATKSPERAEAASKMQRGWEAIGILADSPEMARLRAEAKRHLQREATAPEKPRKMSIGLPAWPLAAGLAASVVLVLGLYNQYHAKPIITWNFRAPADRIRVVNLMDGSKVVLDRGSQIKVRFGEKTRDVELTGQGQFDVAHDKARPFAVRSGDREVKALGTRFNVLQETGRLEVSLIEGRVLLSRLEDESSWLGLKHGLSSRPLVRLEPGQRFVEVAYAEPRIMRFDADEAAAWKHGRVVFNAERLGRAAEIMSRHSATKIIVSDQSLMDRRISGAFSVGNATAFAEALGLIYPDVKLTAHDQSLMIERKNFPSR